MKHIQMVVEVVRLRKRLTLREHDLSIILANVDDAVKINIGNMFDNGSINHSSVN